MSPSPFLQFFVVDFFYLFTRIIQDCVNVTIIWFLALIFEWRTILAIRFTSCISPVYRTCTFPFWFASPTTQSFRNFAPVFSTYSYLKSFFSYCVWKKRTLVSNLYSSFLTLCLPALVLYACSNFFQKLCRYLHFVSSYVYKTFVCTNDRCNKEHLISPFFSFYKETFFRIFSYNHNYTYITVLTIKFI